MKITQTKRSLLHKSLLAGFLVAVSGYSMQASAMPNEPFSFHQSSGFLVDGTLTGTGTNKIGWYQFGSTPPPPAGEFNTLAWGTPVTTGTVGPLLTTNPIGPATGNPATDLSALRVIGLQSTLTTLLTTGAADPNGGSLWGGWQSISTLYHQNRAIDITADMLRTAVIRSVLTIDHTPGGDIASDTNSLGISFNETFNGLTNGVCPALNPNGSVCDDLFGFNKASFAPISFVYGGERYDMEFQLANFVNSAANYPTCPGGTCTVWTAENVTSSLDVQARIRQEVPEPATLGLFSLGLLGLGFAKRRQRNG